MFKRLLKGASSSLVSFTDACISFQKHVSCGMIPMCIYIGVPESHTKLKFVKSTSENESLTQGLE